MTIKEMMFELTDEEMVEVFKGYPRELCNACILMSLEDQMKKEGN